jgi:Uma2 family endonuclease
VEVKGPDGAVFLKQVPLTLEDVLFPKTGDFIVHSDLHDDDVNYLKSVFKARLAGDAHAVVVSDCRVDWNVPGVEPLGPDIAVFFDVKRYREWFTLDVAAEGATPAVVVEVTSPSTRTNDLETKLDLYHQAGVPSYLIADAVRDDADGRRLELLAFRHTPRGYERVIPDARGRVYLEPLGLWVGNRSGPTPQYERLACFDGDTGEEFGDYTAVCQARAAEAKRRTQAEERAAAAQARATEAETRVHELEAELKQLRERGSSSP